MDNKNNNFKEFHTVHRLHGFTDWSTSFQMCVKKCALCPIRTDCKNAILKI